MDKNELMMSDIPWAVAWYGQRQCVWLTLNAEAEARDPRWPESFYAINDVLKPIKAIYLTPETLDRKLVSEWIRAGELSWGDFVTRIILKSETPAASFPLRTMPPGYLPEQLFLCDRARWNEAR
jgi:hypothetical protein